MNADPAAWDQGVFTRNSLLQSASLLSIIVTDLHSQRRYALLDELNAGSLLDRLGRLRLRGAADSFCLRRKTSEETLQCITGFFPTEKALASSTVRLAQALPTAGIGEKQPQCFHQAAHVIGFRQHLPRDFRQEIRKPSDPESRHGETPRHRFHGRHAAGFDA